jgi:hypothetical protein
MADRKPHRWLEVTHKENRAQLDAPAGAPAVESVFTLNKHNLLRWIDFIRRLMPLHRFTPNAEIAAAGVLMLLFDGLLDQMTMKFAAESSLKPGTRSYCRAEFRNTMFTAGQGARAFNQGAKTPVYFMLYMAFSAGGAGYHPDPDIARKWREGMSEDDRDESERWYKSWRNHLRNRVALVSKALKPSSGLSEKRRQRIITEDPLIAFELRRAIAPQLRQGRGKVR